MSTQRIFLFFFISFFSSVVFAQNGRDLSATPPSFQPKASSDAIENHQAQEMIEDLTVLSIMDEIEGFTERKESIQQKILELKKSSDIEERFDELRKNLQEKNTELQRLRLRSSWDFRRVNQFRTNVKPVLDQAEALKEQYLQFIKESEELLAELQRKKEYFLKSYEKIRKDESLRIARLPIRNTINDINNLTQKIKNLRHQYTQNYQKHAEVIKLAHNLAKNLEKEMEYFKEAHFTKTSPAFFESEYFQKFKQETYQEMKVSWAEIWHFEKKWLQQSQELAFGFLIGFFFLSFVFKKLRELSELKPNLRHPYFLAFTASLLLTGFFIPVSFLLFKLTYWVFFVVLLFLVSRGLRLEKWQKQDTMLLVLLFVLIQAGDVFGIPLPLYRIYLFALALAGSVYSFWRSKQWLNENSKSLIFIKWGYQVLFVIFGLIAFLELLGFHLLAAFAIRGVVKSLFFILLVDYLRYFFLALIKNIFETSLQKASWLKKHKKILYKKIHFLFHAFLTIVVILTLTIVWGVFEDLSAAWVGFFQWGVSIRGQKLTLGTVFTGILILFLIISFTQVITQVLEDEVYPRKSINIGTGKSINILLKYLAWVIGFFFLFHTLGFELRQVAIIAGALSVGIGFGLQNIVNNFVSGLILLFERPIKVGDILEIDNDLGTVEKMGLRSTVIRSYSKTQIIIPNSDFITKKVENLTYTDPDYRVTIQVGVAYGSDTNLVRKVLLEVAQTHPDVVSDPEPVILFNNFGDNSLNFEMWAWTHDASRKRLIMSEIHFAIDQKFREHGVEIPFPQRTLHLQSIGKDVVDALQVKKE